VKIAVDVDDNGRELWDTVKRHAFGNGEEQPSPRNTPNKIEELKRAEKESSFLQRSTNEGRTTRYTPRRKCDPQGYNASKKFKPCKRIEYRAASRPEIKEEDEEDETV
ncbi:hypothetical protein FOZ63_000325, partial [Perkinsus olseni]